MFEYISKWRDPVGHSLHDIDVMFQFMFFCLKEMQLEASLAMKMKGQLDGGMMEIISVFVFFVEERSIMIFTTCAQEKCTKI